MSQNLKDTTVKGLVWSSLERFSVQGVQFIVMLVIARILSPKDFGLVGMLTIFIAVAQSLIDSGFSQALIRKQNKTIEDESTVFYFNVSVSFFVYLVLYLISPSVAAFYDEPQLEILMKVLCLIVIINSFSVVQRAIYTAAIDFKTQAKASFIAAFFSGLIGIYFATNNYGAWSLVWQQLSNALVNTLLLWFFSDWHPIFICSKKSFVELFGFGSKLMVSGLIATVYNNMFLLVIGKYFTAETLGFYSQADRFSKFPSSNLTGILQHVTYPALCKLQNKPDELKKDYRLLLRLSAFVVFPLMCLLAGVAYPLIDLVIGCKWHFAATLLIPLCFSMMWYPIHAINLNLLQVLGRSDFFLKLEIIKKIVCVSILVVSIPFGVLAVCYSSILASLVCLIINTYYTKKLIGVGFRIQICDMSRTIISSFIMFFIVSNACYFTSNLYMELLVGIALGLLFYFGVAYLFKFSELSYLAVIVKDKIGVN